MVYYSQGRRRDAARIWQKGLIASRYAYCPFEFGTADHYNQYSLAKPNIAFQLSELFNDSPDSVYKYTLWRIQSFARPLLVAMPGRTIMQKYHRGSHRHTWTKGIR